MVINFSDFDFLLLALSTNSKILLTVESSYFLVTFIFKIPSKLIHPLKISSSLQTFLGVDSPVKAFVSKNDEPSTIIPSIGTFSPGLTKIISPILTSSGSTFSSFSSLKTFA